MLIARMPVKHLVHKYETGLFTGVHLVTSATSATTVSESMYAGMEVLHREGEAGFEEALSELGIGPEHVEFWAGV